MKMITLCPDDSPEQASPGCTPAAQYCHVSPTGASWLHFAPSWPVGVRPHTAAPGHCGAWEQENKHWGRGKRRARSTGPGHSMVPLIAGGRRHVFSLQF